MAAQPTLTPSFKAFQALAGRLRLEKPEAPDMALALKHLLATAPQQDENSFKAKIQGFLIPLKKLLDGMTYHAHPGVFQNLEKLMSNFAHFIKEVEPKLAQDIQVALGKNNVGKKKALLKLLAGNAFSAALAPNLKAFLTPSRLSPKENIDKTLAWAFDSLHQDNEHVASQAAYGENAWVRQLLRLLFSMVKMVSAAPLRDSAEHEEQHEKERRIPMMMPAAPAPHG